MARPKVIPSQGSEWKSEALKVRESVCVCAFVCHVGFLCIGNTYPGARRGQANEVTTWVLHSIPVLCTPPSSFERPSPCPHVPG